MKLTKEERERYDAEIAGMTPSQRKRLQREAAEAQRTKYNKYKREWYARKKAEDPDYFKKYKGYQVKYWQRQVMKRREEGTVKPDDQVKQWWQEDDTDQEGDE